MAETSRDFDTCGFIHKNGWRCGGMRKNHSDNYKEHEFTEVTTNPTPTQQETLELCPFCGTKPETGITGDAALSAMWQALIRETCINPASAKTVVFLGEEKFRQALAPFVKSPAPAESWIDKLAGTFDDSPVYAEVIANEKRARQWMEEGRCVSCGALPSDAPAASTRVEGEQDERETFAAKHFTFGPCFHSMVKPDCPSCCRSHAARMEMQLGKLEASTALPMRERIEKAVRQQMKHCYQVYKGVPPSVDDWVGGALHYVMWGIERDLPLPTAAAPADNDAEFQCECCQRQMELRIDGKFCNECASGIRGERDAIVAHLSQFDDGELGLLPMLVADIKAGCHRKGDR